MVVIVTLVLAVTMVATVAVVAAVATGPVVAPVTSWRQEAMVAIVAVVALVAFLPLFLCPGGLDDHGGCNNHSDLNGFMAQRIVVATARAVVARRSPPR